MGPNCISPKHLNMFVGVGAKVRNPEALMTRAVGRGGWEMGDSQLIYEFHETDLTDV